MKWGFDTTVFPPSAWFGIAAETRFLFHRRVRDHLNEFEWRSIDNACEFDDRFRIWTTGNPNTGEYYQPQQRSPDIGFAGFIGIEGDDVHVRTLVDLIRRRADYIKGESPERRDFI